ncbi:hypothetical protein [Rhizobium halophytocola]|uniref:Uncharacterized protein n=1 Tax=Rhizobium halophytocola TaxID=735519 RepID=A0ABS4E2M9_9HYPH|nr:hypothetical protein [Rhizobium halophytocola]MBP1852206.1 hypothetical protein [Rhizobium halophytocola]
MKTKINIAALALLIGTTAFADAADTAQEHSTLVKSMMSQNTLSKCRTKNLQAMASEILEQNNGCPKDLDVGALVDKAADSCAAEYDAAYEIMNKALSYSTANAADAKVATDKQMATDKAKWAAKSSQPLLAICQK